MEKGWGNDAPSAVSGKIRRPGPEHELHGLNYNETDDRHDRATHEGWHPVDGNSGEMDPETWDKTRDFPDTGAWRQT